MSNSQTWTTTGPTITTTTTTTDGTAGPPQTVVQHSGPSESTSTTTTTFRSSGSNGKSPVNGHGSVASGAESTENGQKPHPRGMPRDPALHEFNPVHGLGETSEQHDAHTKFEAVEHWGLAPGPERILFYCLAVPSWCFEITSAVLGSWYSSHHPSFIATFTIYLVLHWAAWCQTAVGMAQRASWVRDESNLADRRRYLYLAVRLNRLMLPTAVIAFATFIVAYVRRQDTHDLANWLLFLLFFIFGTVFSVMNAYNNITWESDRLEYEEGSSPYGNTLLACLGIPSKPRPYDRERID